MKNKTNEENKTPRYRKQHSGCQKGGQLEVGLGEGELEERTGSKAECSTSSHLPKFTFLGVFYKIEEWNAPLRATKIGLSIPLAPSTSSTHSQAPDSARGSGNHRTQSFPKAPLGQPGAPSLAIESTSPPLALPKQKWPESKSEIWWKKLRQDAILSNFQEDLRWSSCFLAVTGGNRTNLPTSLK